MKITPKEARELNLKQWEEYQLLWQEYFAKEAKDLKDLED